MVIVASHLQGYSFTFLKLLGYALLEIVLWAAE